MKFGDTIIRNLLAENIENPVVEGHKKPGKRDTSHGVQKENDLSRGFKK